MSIKTPRLIRDRCGVYYFRLVVPLHWRETVGKAELRRSLRTKDVVTALTNEGVNDGLKRALVGHDIDTKESSHDDYIHARFLTLPNLREAINKLAYEGVDFGGLRVEPAVFLSAVDRRISEQDKAARKELAASGGTA